MLQHKTIKLDDCQVKFEGDGGQFAGYASVFGGVDYYGDTGDASYDETGPTGEGFLADEPELTPVPLN